MSVCRCLCLCNPDTIFCASGTARGRQIEEEGVSTDTVLCFKKHIKDFTKDDFKRIAADILKHQEVKNVSHLRNVDRIERKDGQTYEDAFLNTKHLGHVILDCFKKRKVVFEDQASDPHSEGDEDSGRSASIQGSRSPPADAPRSPVAEINTSEARVLSPIERINRCVRRCQFSNGGGTAFRSRGEGVQKVHKWQTCAGITDES